MIGLPRSWLAVLGAVWLVFAIATHGADFPSKPIRIVVPFPAGSGSDVVTRKLAESLSSRLKQPVIVDNRPGAAGTLGAQIVARAAPDGYTLLYITNGVLAINPHVQPSPGFDMRKAFTPVIHLADVPGVVVVPARLKVLSLREFVALARQRPGELNYASSGLGSVQHLAIEQFDRLAGIRMAHIPFKGEAEVVNALLGDQVDLALLTFTVSSQHIRSERMRALAVTSSQRLPALPEVPTIAQAGYEGYEFRAATGLVAPAATPNAIIERLYREVAAVLTAPEMKQWMEDVGREVIAAKPEDFSALLARDYKRFGELVRTLGLRPE